MRFFFHVTGGGSLRDKDGIDLPDAAAARTEAVNYALNLSGLQLGLSGRSTAGMVIVTDEGGQEVLTVAISQVDE
jgi:hypothetical protein